MSSGHAGVCWKPPAGQGAADAQNEVSELVGDGFGYTVDSFGYGWLLLDDPDLEDLVTKVHMANSTLQDNGWGPQLLCSVFGFVPGPDAAERRQAVLARLPVQARHLLPVRPGGPAEGAARHRARAAHPHHGRGGPAGRARPVRAGSPCGTCRSRDGRPVTPYSGSSRSGGRGQLPRPRRVRGPAVGHRTRWRSAVPGRRPGRADRVRPRPGAASSRASATVIDLRSGDELERGRFDVDAHPVDFHHFPFIEELPDAEEFDRPARPAGLAVPRDASADAGGQIRAALEVLAAPGALRPSSTARRARTGPASCRPSCSRCSASTSRPSWPTTRSAARPWSGCGRSSS